MAKLFKSGTFLQRIEHIRQSAGKLVIETITNDILINNLSNQFGLDISKHL